MRVRLTLVGSDADPIDLAITADAAATVADLAGALAHDDPRGTAPALAGAAELTLRVHDRPGGPAATGRLLPAGALAGQSVRSGSVVSVALPGGEEPAQGPVPAAARLTVLEGPDAGTSLLLPQGTAVIGRGRDCQVRLTDPTVSQEHARLAVGDAVEIVDLRSSNGLLLGDGPVQRAVLAPQDTVTLGDTTLRVTRTATGRHAAGEAAQVEFNRSPRVTAGYAGQEHEAPEPPEPPPPSRFPVVMLLVPALMAPVMYAAGRGWLGLVLLAMMPLMVLGSYVDRRVTGRREHRAAVAQFAAAVDQMRAERAVAREQERRARLAGSPSVTELHDAALALGPLLWTRRPEHEEFLELRLGLATLPSRDTVVLPRRGSALPAQWELVLALREEFGTVDAVPATARLRSSGALGVAGPRPVTDDVARAVVAQLVVLHSPAEVVLAVVTSAASAPRWAWARWLPHTASPQSPLNGAHLGSDRAGVAQLVSRVEGLLDARRGVALGRGPATLPAVVLVVEDDAPVERGRLVRIAEDGPAVGVHAVWCAPSVARLPAVCRTFVAVATGADATGADAARAGYVQRGETVQPLVCDALDATAVAALARHLAAVGDAGAPVDDAADLPGRESFLALVGPECAEGPARVLASWQETGSLMPRGGSAPARRHDAHLRAVVGRGAGGTVTLDLRTQGPHALVGGTTGAGKSEFLQSWVLGMAVAHSPDRVTFLFVDYKGGAAFADCLDLPHTVGLVTDLSPHLVRRALTSLRAELQHRERLLDRKGAKDLLALERTGDPQCPPSLVVVVDEFAALATEVPEFVDGVVDVAQRGRSLGLHLVLATQRPAGVIRDNLRANTNLRVALRMNDEADSLDVLGLPLAAAFDPAVPGRGAVRTGPGRVTMFQTGYAGGRTTTAAPRPRVDVETLVMGAGTRWEARGPVAAAPPYDVGPTDVRRIVDSVSAAARTARVPAPRRPWLPTLPPVIDLATLGPATDSALVLGVVDDPARQRQLTTHYRPDVDGNIVLYGAGGSGKSTALRTLAAAAGTTPDGGPVQVYGLDFAAGGLAALDALPHVGAVIDGEDVERVQRLLRRLRDTVEERSGRYARARAGTITEYRTNAEQPDEARILVLLDGFGAFRAEWEGTAARLAWFQTFRRLLVDGRGVGVHVAISADRAGTVPAAVAGSLPRRIVLRQADPDGYALLGVPRDVLDESSPPGRALTADGLEMQVAVPGGAANLVRQVRAIEELADGLRRAGVPAAPAVRRLPELVAADEVPPLVASRPVLGVADDTLEPIGFDPVGTFLLAGPAQSGRTAALRWLATAVRRAHPDARLVYLGARRSVLPRLDLWHAAATGVTDVAALAATIGAELAVPPAEGEVGTVVVIESLTDFLGSAADLPLVELVRAARRNEHLVIGESETATWSSSWPLVAELRGGRRGLALQPDQVEGDLLFRTPFPRLSRAEFPVGRGIVVDRARVRRVQLPLVG
ncbi:FtsK/SpoIIIE domain-containing protein [Georgenia sp. MJ170]|uniref:FtsK/SpoIIIE domain-containing protein n=1 Tax=Georgenia sunbinii TaxID=3117728 RepID=UPI002F26A48A